MGLFLLFSLAAGSAALLGVINLFDGNSATPEASAEEIALLEGDAITATEQMLADDPTRGEDIEALDLTPFTTEYDEYYVDFTATPGDDLIVLPEEGSADYPDYGTGSVIFGDEGDDTMIGQSAGDVFFGEAGDDELFGGGGNDQLFGGAGNDLLSGGPGNDLLTTETADGSDTLYGGAGDDEIAAFGEIGTDAIHHISGGAGDDNITLQGGAYLVSLGSGADMVTLQPEDGESGVSSAALISDFDVTEDTLMIMVEGPSSSAATALTYTLSQVETDLGLATLVEPAVSSEAVATALAGSVNGGVALLLGVTPDQLTAANIQVVLG